MMPWYNIICIIAIERTKFPVVALYFYKIAVLIIFFCLSSHPLFNNTSSLHPHTKSKQVADEKKFSKTEADGIHDKFFPARKGSRPWKWSVSALVIPLMLFRP
jgi:hypothetical protein